LPLLGRAAFWMCWCRAILNRHGRFISPMLLSKVAVSEPRWLLQIWVKSQVHCQIDA